MKPFTMRVLIPSSIFLVGLMLSAIAGVSAQGLVTDHRTATQIMNQTTKAYLTCKTYADSGEYHGESGNATFSTAFVRPGKFHFDWKHDGLLFASRYIISADGSNVTFSSFYPLMPAKKEKLGSLGDAVASGTGVTYGVAHGIPVLLLPKEVGGTSINDMTNIRRLSDAFLGKTLCYRISGMFFRDSIILWIDKRTLLILKIEEGSEITTYTPVMNGPVSAAMLQSN